MEEKQGINGYEASDIIVLEGLEPVRQRPAMYIGSTGPLGLHHLVSEVVDNSIDEIYTGGCDRIEVVVHYDNSVTVTDNGRGIPVGPHPDHPDRSALEIVMTILHAGGKFKKGSYKVSGGLHGVGVSCVNALSEWLEVEVRREGGVYFQRYQKGNPVAPVERIGNSRKTGTKVVFLPDKTILDTIDFSYDTLANRLRELAFLNSGVTIRISDERSSKEAEFYFKGGIVEFVKHLNHNKEVVNQKPIHFQRTKETDPEKGDMVEVEIALQYNAGYQENI